MIKNFSLYVLDCETTGLDYLRHGIIEISALRLNDQVQKTWCIKPENCEIDNEALKINHHKLEDINHLTEFGRQTYKPSSQVIIDIENWMMEDEMAPSDRILCGQNVYFDLNFLEKFWERNNSKDTFPFGKRPFVLDTRQIALFLDLCNDERQEYYNLGNLIKKYGIKNEKAHTAAADVSATTKLFVKQLEIVRDAIKT